MDKGSGAVRRVPFWRSLQTKFALTYIVVIAAVLVLLNTYPVLVSQDLVFHSITTGASNDIEQATKVARSMITRFGMNEEFGMVAFETVTNQYLGGDTSLACSESTAAQIDEKVVAAVRKQYDKAEQLLKDNMPKLHELAKYLYEKETITGDEFMEILNLSPDQLTTTRMETN